MTNVRPQICGGNRVTAFPPGAEATLRMREGPYVYEWIPLDAGASRPLAGLASCTVLCKAEKHASLALGDGGPTLADGDSAQIENVPVTLTAGGGRVTALVAGTAAPRPGGRSVTLARAGAHYRVSKPWGHELWLNEGHPAYCLKELFVTAGSRTSLQYHERKEETILVFSGRMRLVFKAKDEVENDAASPEHLGHTVLSPLSAVHVPPGVLHRLEAVTDVLMYEASTPHLDDVIRVRDDAARPDGRVASEHAG